MANTNDFDGEKNIVEAKSTNGFKKMNLNDYR